MKYEQPIKIADFLSKIQRPEDGKRIMLPTIQRGLVWDNKRIVNYWDSLARGWFPGVFMLRELSGEQGGKAYFLRSRCDQSDGAPYLELKDVCAGDQELFDGQQRFSSILLGFNEGGWAASHKLWISIASKDKTPRFRITTKGQPFGYRLDDQNQKRPLKDRRIALLKFAQAKDIDLGNTPQREVLDLAFATDDSQLLFGEAGWVPLSEIMTSVGANDDEFSVRRFREQIIATELLVHKVTDSEFIDYETFFERIGQGGVRLSDDDLTYALMNKRYPYMRPVIEDMLSRSDVGRLASPTDIALGLFRLARMETTSSAAQEWERANRPNPKYIRELPAGSPASEVFEGFLKSGKATQLLADARKLLLLSDEGDGASAMQLSRADRYALDIALILCYSPKFRDLPERAAFCYWAMFFGDEGAIAYRLAAELSSSDDVSGVVLLKKVVRLISLANKSVIMPSSQQFNTIKLAIQNQDKLTELAHWFSAADNEGQGKPSEAIKQLNFWSNRGKQLLLWSQRNYLNRAYPNYDPTTDRDEELPVDLDHIISSARFAARWSDSYKADIKKKFPNEVDSFRAVRVQLGNLIGNLRWLDASLNRSLGKGSGTTAISENEFEKSTLELASDVVEPAYRDKMLKLSKAVVSHNEGLTGWTRADVIEWQNVVQLRTVQLMETSMAEWGVQEFVDAQHAEL